MADDNERSASASAVFHPRLAPLVVFVGVVSVICDSWPALLPHRAILHALFGVLLWSCVVVRFYGRLHQMPRMLVADIRSFSRHLTRLVYLLLYVLMFCRLAVDIVCPAPPGAILQSSEEFQSYLACGLLALVTIHALTALVQRNGRLT